MDASRLTWLIAFGGALWTWLLASWSGISLQTSLLRATTVFVMLAAVLIASQVVFASARSAQKPIDNRPADEERPVTEDSQEEAAQQQAA